MKTVGALMVRLARSEVAHAQTPAASDRPVTAPMPLPRKHVEAT
jgi:hypothetical protein